MHSKFYLICAIARINFKRTHYVRPFTGFHQYLSGIPCGSASPAGSSAAVMSGRRVSIKFTPLRMSSASVLGSSVHRLMVNSPACRHAETSRSDKSFGSALRPNKPVVCAALTSASISVSYTHLDVYKRQLQACENMILQR